MMEKVDALSAKRRELEAQPSTPSGWHYVPTGQTFDEYWESLSPASRNDFLRDNGVRVDFTRDPGTEPTWRTDFRGILGMIQSVYPGHVAEIRERIAATPGAADVLDPDDPAAILSLVDREPSNEERAS